MYYIQSHCGSSSISLPAFSEEFLQRSDESPAQYIAFNGGSWELYQEIAAAES